MLFNDDVTCRDCIAFTTNPTWSDLESRTSAMRPATNRLSHGTAARRGVKKNAFGISVKKEKNILEELGIDGMIIVKSNLK